MMSNFAEEQSVCHHFATIRFRVIHARFPVNCLDFRGANLIGLKFSQRLLPPTQASLHDR